MLVPFLSNNIIAAYPLKERPLGDWCLYLDIICVNAQDICIQRIHSKSSWSNNFAPNNKLSVIWFAISRSMLNKMSRTKYFKAFADFDDKYDKAAHGQKISLKTLLHNLCCCLLL